MSECDWSYLQTLRTVGGLGAEPMPSLGDLLEFLADDERGAMWVILDVKVRASRLRVVIYSGTPVWLGRGVLLTGQTDG